jgi:hypothetical protein
MADFTSPWTSISNVLPTSNLWALNVDARLGDPVLSHALLGKEFPLRAPFVYASAGNHVLEPTLRTPNGAHAAMQPPRSHTTLHRLEAAATLQDDVGPGTRTSSKRTSQWAWVRHRGYILRERALLTMMPRMAVGTRMILSLGLLGLTDVGARKYDERTASPPPALLIHSATCWYVTGRRNVTKHPPRFQDVCAALPPHIHLNVLPIAAPHKEFRHHIRRPRECSSRQRTEPGRALRGRAAGSIRDDKTGF